VVYFYNFHKNAQSKQSSKNSPNLVTLSRMRKLTTPILMSDTLDAAKVDFGRHSVSTIVFLSIIYAILSLSAFSGNSLVIWIISKSL
jgi:hypothetical protein